MPTSLAQPGGRPHAGTAKGLLPTLRVRNSQPPALVNGYVCITFDQAGLAH